MDLSTTIHLLGEALGDVIRTQESTALFETEERIRALAKARRLGDPAAAKQLAGEIAALPDDDARATASAFAVYFDLVNLAEEVHRIRPFAPANEACIRGRSVSRSARRSATWRRAGPRRSGWPRCSARCGSSWC